MRLRCWLVGAILARDTSQFHGFLALTWTQENTPNRFSYAYTGRKLGLDATRTFRFTSEPVDHDGAGSRTLFTHYATWEGYAAVMFMSWSPIRARVRRLFEGFHIDLKKAVEKESDQAGR